MDMLTANPYIKSPSHEVHFFDRDKLYETGGLEAYVKAMPETTADQVTIEKTPKYFVHKPVPERIYRMNKNIKLILILRDPIKRLISDYNHEKTRNDWLIYPDAGHRVQFKRIEKQYSLEELVFSKDGQLNMSYAPVVASLYHIHMAHWLQYFSRDQFLLLDGEKFAVDPLHVLHRCEEFLGVPHRITSDMFVFNQTTGHFCKTGKQCSLERKPKHEYSEKFLSKLKELYAPHTQRLFDMIGRFDWPSTS